jgi:hypothetical protein
MCWSCLFMTKGPHRFILMHQFNLAVEISLSIRALFGNGNPNTPRNVNDKILLMHQNGLMRTLIYDFNEMGGCVDLVRWLSGGRVGVVWCKILYFCDVYVG